MADVLSLLREYHLNGKPIAETSSEIIFGDFAWPKSTKTNFLVWGSGKEGTTKDYYTLDCVVYLLKHINLPHTQYVRQAASAGLPVVRLPDRRDLLAYLKGETSTAPNIDRAAPVDISLRRPVTKRQVADLHAHARQDASDAIIDGYGPDSDAKRARLMVSANEVLDSNLSNYDSQNQFKSLVLDDDAISREKRLLAAKLDNSFANRASVEQSDQAKTSSLPEAVPLDKIQTWRAKFRATQQQRIKTTDVDQNLETSVTVFVDHGNDVNCANLAAPVLDERDTRVGLHTIVPSGDPKSVIKIDDSTHSTLLRASLVADEAPVRRILDRERRWRTRVSVLQSQGKTFYENIVLGILRNVILKEDSHSLPDQKSNTKLGYVASGVQQPVFPQPLAVGTYYPNPSAGATNCTNPGSAMALSTGQPGMSVTNSTVPHHGQMHYSRYDQERFAGGREDTAGFRIDTMGTYHGKALASMVTVNMNKSNVDIPNQTGGATPARSARTTGGETPSAPYEPQTPRDPRGINSGIPVTPSATPDPYRNLRSAADARLAARSKMRASRIPIIIIPASPTSLITMYNVRDILQDLNFVKPQVKQAAGIRRENEILVHRQKLDGRSVPYRIVDQPNKLVLEEWNRVVAVFVQGQLWQFKGWPISSDPAVIFSQVKGFHLKYTNMPLDTNVAKWNVRVIELDDRRHLDKANFQQIWDQLDKHIARNKPFLRS